MFFYFSNRLGCGGSLLVSLVITVTLLVTLRALEPAAYQLLTVRETSRRQWSASLSLDRRHELIILAHSMAAMPPGQLALRREEAIDLLEELTQLRGRHQAPREALRRLDGEP